MPEDTEPIEIEEDGPPRDEDGKFLPRKDRPPRERKRLGGYVRKRIKLERLQAENETLLDELESYALLLQRALAKLEALGEPVQPARWVQRSAGAIQ